MDEVKRSVVMVSDVVWKVNRICQVQRDSFLYPRGEVVGDNEGLASRTKDIDKGSRPHYSATISSNKIRTKRHAPSYGYRNRSVGTG
jgi:hypothetical protein